MWFTGLDQVILFPWQGQVALFGFPYLVLLVHDLTTTTAASTKTASGTEGGAIVTPAGTPLSVGTIPGHMTGIATDTTDDVCRVILLLGAVVLPVADLAAVLAGLVLVVAEGTVERSELTKLVTLELVLAFGYGGGL